MNLNLKISLSFLVANGVINVNEAIDNADSADLLLALKSKSIALRSITPECTEQYHSELKFAKGQKDDSCNLIFFSLKKIC